LENKITSPPVKHTENIVIDFRKLFSKILSAWWLFLLSLIIAYSCANLYLRYATFEYAARAILLIKDTGSSGNISAESILINDEAISGSKAMDNEIQILKSLTIMEKVVKRLDLEVFYYRIGNFKETELYTETPFVLDSFFLETNAIFGVDYLIEQNDYQSFLLREKEDDLGEKFYYGIPFQTDKGQFTISLNPTIAVIKGQYRLKVLPLESAANAFKFALGVQRIGSQNASSVLELSMLNPVAQKASDILNTLIEIYNEEEIKDENQVLGNTLDFIDERVKSLVKELDLVEGGIQRYKSNNEIISDNAASSMSYTLGEIRSSIKAISAYEIQKNTLEVLEDFLIQNQADTLIEMIPVNLIVESPALSGFVGQYNGMVTRYKQMILTATKKNPSRIALEDQIKDLKKVILSTIQNQKRDLEIPIAEIELNVKELQKNMENVPVMEKTLTEKMRTQAIKENLFLYLLQKREETALSEAITTAKTRTIDRARVSKFPVYPKRKLIISMSMVLGLIIPFLLVLISGLFEYKIQDEESIKQLTSIPILGRISFEKGAENIVVKHGNRSAINEMFRLLRTNLNFINHNKEKQTIMFTSSVSGEGKTFIAINLGITLALSGKKVIILGMDLRKPKLATYIEAKNEKGISNFLVGQNTLPEIIQQRKDIPNLSFITSGPIPPNPAELILSERMEVLFSELSKQYDYILFDTPPIGLVSDALLLRKYVDRILIIVRHKLTHKGMVKNLERMYSENELKNANIIFNGIKKGRKYYGYGGYYYGKNQGYYVEE